MFSSSPAVGCFLKKRLLNRGGDHGHPLTLATPLKGRFVANDHNYTSDTKLEISLVSAFKNAVFKLLSVSRPLYIATYIIIALWLLLAYDIFRTDAQLA